MIWYIYQGCGFSNSVITLKSVEHNRQDDGLLESGIVAKEITQTMHEDRRSYERDETVYSVVFSFNKKLQTEKNNGN